MNKLFLSIAIVLCNVYLNAQTQLNVPQASQFSSVTQRIGITDITITYHSPLAKGRVIWGTIVPYNDVWRAGANESTTITFTNDVKIEGKALAAGTYGLHMIPTQKEWTVIFSKNAGAWGSFFYNQQEDALRATVTPKAVPMQDWLSYSFAEPKEQSVLAVLQWEKIAVPFKIEVDVPETVVQNMRKELTGLNGFFWQGYNQAAAYCIRNNVYLDEAAAWVDRSIGIQKNFSNLTTKATLLEKQGKKSTADSLRKQAFPLADENQVNTYGYELMGAGKVKEAIEIFKLNVKKFPNSWNVFDSLAEALNTSGDKKGAIDNYKIALAKAPENQKKRIEGIIKTL